MSAGWRLARWAEGLEEGPVKLPVPWMGPVGVSRKLVTYPGGAAEPGLTDNPEGKVKDCCWGKGQGPAVQLPCRVKEDRRDSGLVVLVLAWSRVG